MIYINNRNKNIQGTIAIFKLGTLLYIVIEIIHALSKHEKLMGEPVFEGLSILAVCLIPLGFLLMYFIWTFTCINIWNTKRSNMSQIAENYVFVLLISTLILLTNSFERHYEILYLVAIISASVGLGKMHGILISLFSSVTVLGVDLVYVSNSNVNLYFQKDLLLCAAFIICAWILGEYVKYETNQIGYLEQELDQQLKKHDYFEKMLIQNEAGYNMLIKGSPDPILIHNMEGLLYANENASKLMAVNSSYNVITELGITQIGVSAKEIYSEILQGKKVEVSFEEKIVNSDGNAIIVNNTSTYCIYGKKPAILTVLRDITPVKQVEQLKEDVQRNIELLNNSMEYNRQITEFFSNISHELKTPLNVIFSSLQLMNLYNEKNDEETILKKGDYLKVARLNCLRLTRLINNILDMTKLDAGFVVSQMENRDIISAVEDITMSVLPYSEDKGIEIIFDTDYEERIIAFDHDKLERIILNLLSNALKFTDRGGHIYVGIENEEDKVSISVRDTGIGIPEEKQAQIFERFMQVDKTIRRNQEGTGIGLSLVKSLVELHNGQINLKSKLNVGSQFTVMLPAVLVSEASYVETEIKSNSMDRVVMELSDIYVEVKNEI